VIECTLDDVVDGNLVTAEPCDGDYTPSVVPLTDGHSYTLTVVVTSNISGLSQQFVSSLTVDAGVPVVSIDSPPSTTSNSGAGLSVSTTGTVTAVSLEVDVDGNGYEPWANGQPLPGSPLSDGSHTISVRAISASGVSSAADDTATWVIDASAPIIVSLLADRVTANVLDGVVTPGESNTRQPVFVFTTSDATDGDSSTVVSCSITSAANWIDNGVVTAPCTSPYMPAHNLPEGDAVLTIVTADSLGTTNTIDIPFTVDTVAPDVILSTGPANHKSGVKASFTFTTSPSQGPGLHFECQVVPLGSTPASQAMPWTTCSSPFTVPAQYMTVSGQRTLFVKAVDSATNESLEPSAYTWNANVVAPVISLNSTPAKQTTGDDNVFTFSSDQDPLVNFTCKVDAGTVGACKSGFIASVAEGVHTITVGGTNDVGSAATSRVYSWTVTTPATKVQTVTTIVNTVQAPTPPAPPATTVITPGPSVTGTTETVTKTTELSECPRLSKSPGRSAAKKVAGSGGISLRVQVSRTVSYVGDKLTFSLITVGKGSASKRLSTVTKLIKSIKLTNRGKTIGTMRASNKWKVAWKTPNLGAGRLTTPAKFTVSMKKGKAIQGSVIVHSLSSCA
jgi:hypothetical protein